MPAPVTMPVSFFTPEPQSFVSERAKARAGALESELATTKQLDAVILQILNARRYCPRVFDEFKPEILAAINDDLGLIIARLQPETTAQKAATAKTIAESARLTEEYRKAEHGKADDQNEATGVEKLIEFFRARGNVPTTIDDMAKAIGKTKVTVKVIVYKRHKDKFERMRERGKNNAAYFRLKQT